VPIDHGYCLPSRLSVAWCDWCWLSWPQTKQPMDEDTLAFIRSLDPWRDARRLHKETSIGPECTRNMIISTLLLKLGAEQGLSVADIAEIMCRSDLDSPSDLEVAMERAETLAESMMRSPRMRAVVARSPEPSKIRRPKPTASPPLPVPTATSSESSPRSKDTQHRDDGFDADDEGSASQSLVEELSTPPRCEKVPAVGDPSNVKKNLNKLLAEEFNLRKEDVDGEKKMGGIGLLLKQSNQPSRADEGKLLGKDVTVGLTAYVRPPRPARTKHKSVENSSSLCTSDDERFLRSPKRRGRGGSFSSVKSGSDYSDGEKSPQSRSGSFSSSFVKPRSLSLNCSPVRGGPRDTDTDMGSLSMSTSPKTKAPGIFRTISLSHDIFKVGGGDNEYRHPPGPRKVTKLTSDMNLGELKTRNGGLEGFRTARENYFFAYLQKLIADLVEYKLRTKARKKQRSGSYSSSSTDSDEVKQNSAVADRNSDGKGDNCDDGMLLFDIEEYSGSEWTIGG